MDRQTYLTAQALRARDVAKQKYEQAEARLEVEMAKWNGTRPGFSDRGAGYHADTFRHLLALVGEYEPVASDDKAC